MTGLPMMGCMRSGACDGCGSLQLPGPQQLTGCVLTLCAVLGGYRLHIDV